MWIALLLIKKKPIVWSVSFLFSISQYYKEVVSVYQVSIELIKISNLKIRFSLVIADTQDPSKKRDDNILTKTSSRGNTYVNFTPRGRIVLEYIPEKSTQWESSFQIGFTKATLYPFIRKLQEFISNFKIQNLFGYERNNRLFVNKEVSVPNRLVMQTINKACTLEYCVVRDTVNQDVEYEGCVLKINKDANFVLLTYNEILTVFDVLARVNMEQLSCHAMQLSLLAKDIPTKTFGNYEVPPQEADNLTIYRAPSNIDRPKLFP